MTRQTTKYGLKQDQLAEIIDIVSGYQQVEELIIYGSRATGRYRVGSDVDLVIKGRRATIQTAAALKSQLEEETWLPYLFGVTSYGAIESAELKKDIADEGRLIWQRPKPENMGSKTKT